MDINCDLSNHEDIKSAFISIRNEGHIVDVLINCAGVGHSNMLMVEGHDELTETFMINSVAPMILMQLAARQMRKNKFGRIINIGSINEILKPNGSAAYSSSKKALSTISEVASKELISYGITVNTINLGAYGSGMSNKLNPIYLKNLLESLPIKSKVNLSEVVHLINFFVDKKSATITGQKIAMSGVN